jgi:NAD(P)-dependent dehydrogenase (short-subunit alcohol dehydrogenase family)
MITNRLVLVTGGSSGIGAAAAVALAAAGHRPLIADIKVLTHDLRDDSAIYWEKPFDVAQEASVAEGVAAIEVRHGPINGLVNAAGILGKMHSPERLNMTDWDREVGVDLRGTFLMCREVGRRMALRRSGAIVNVASVAGMTSAPVHGYAPAKAAVINLTMSLAAEWGPSGVRVNAVSPGFTRTPALEAGIRVGALSLNAMTTTAALGRLVEPGEVGRAIAWLIDSASSGVTGINLPVDAGFLAGVTWLAYGGLRAPQNSTPA